MNDNGKCQNAQYTANIMEALNKLKRETKESVPYECHASSSNIGAVISKNQTGKRAEVKVNAPLNSNWLVLY